MNNHRRGACAFTLIELLVVIGLIGLLIGGVGFAFTDRSGSSLATAQQVVASLCGTARAQAALHQTDTRVLVYAERPPDGDPDKYLRLMQVYRADPADSETWVACSGAIYLPRAIYVVPPSVDSLIAPAMAWPDHGAIRGVLIRASGGIGFSNPGVSF
jgi:prepilin-type N-terminal cleavage/methylation domain-containing protein